MCTTAIRLLPARVWFRIRDRAQIVRQMDYERCPVLLVVDSWIEEEVRLYSSRKEPGTVAWIEDCFRPGDVFYDIGANVGAYSLIAFRFLEGRVKIYAFEPGFTTFPQLCKNIYLNGANGVVIPLQVALTDENALISFHYQNLTTGGALHALGEPINQKGEAFRPVFSLPTLSYRLDDLVTQFGLQVPNHIKIDVDGVEYQILKGAVETLKHSRLRSLLLEFNTDREEAKKITPFLEECGMKLHSRQNENNLYVREE